MKLSEMGEFTIHNIRFYDFEPKAIQCMAYEDETNRLALSRADGSIEIWNCISRPFMQLVLHGDTHTSIEALQWCKGRLFSAGLNGFLLEHDLATSGVKSCTAVTGGPTWCLALSADKKKLAAGTEEGYVCIFQVLEEGIIYENSLEKQEGRILNICWHCSGDYIVTGSMNCVRVWSLKEGRVTRCSLGQTSDDEEIIVWCVGILDDMTVISGDSRGDICFWNAKLGTITDVVQTHKADVLCLVVCPDQKSVYVAGIDPVIAQVRYVNAGSKKQKGCWMKSVMRSVHTHDVRALALTKDEALFSGGVDTILTMTSYPPKTVIKFPPQLYPGSISVAGEAESILLRYKEHLELWQLGSSSEDSSPSARYLPISQDRVKLLELHCRKDEVIDWCAMSPQAGWIAYIVKGNLRIFQFYPPKLGSHPSVRRVRGISKEIKDSRQVLWLGEARLASASTDGIIQIIALSEMEANLQTNLTVKPGCNVIQMNCNPEGSVLVAVDDSQNVIAFDLDQGTSATLPSYNCPVTAIGVHPSTKDIVVVYSDMMVKEYCLATQRYTPFCREFLSTNSLNSVKRNSVIYNVTFDSRNPNLILLHDDSSIIVLNKTKKITDQNFSKAAKIQCNYSSSDKGGNSFYKSSGVNNIGVFSFIKRSNQVIYFSYVKDKSAVSVELNPLQLLDKLPPALKRKKYGGV